MVTVVSMVDVNVYVWPLKLDIVSIKVLVTVATGVENISVWSNVNCQ